MYNTLTWKLHFLSVNLLVGMDVLEEEKSRDMYETLQGGLWEAS